MLKSLACVESKHHDHRVRAEGRQIEAQHAGNQSGVCSSVSALPRGGPARAVGEETEASSEKEGHVASRNLCRVQMPGHMGNVCTLYPPHTDNPPAVVTDGGEHLVTI